MNKKYSIAVVADHKRRNKELEMVKYMDTLEYMLAVESYFLAVESYFEYVDRVKGLEYEDKRSAWEEIKEDLGLPAWLSVPRREIAK